LRRREGDPGEDLPRDTTRPAQGSEPAAKCSGGGVAMRVSSSQSAVSTFDFNGR
jgi:hypothetical protein